MKKYVYPLLLMLVAPIVLVSCFDDDETIEYDDHCYISGFSLGSLKRTLYTLSSEGADSAYTTTFAGSSFPMTINQRTATIENLDSLPVRTNVSAVLATVTFQGSLAWRKADLTGLEDTTWTTYNSKDSLDFSDSLHFAVVAADSRSHRIYTVKVNVHQQRGDTTVWNALGEASALDTLGARKALCWNNQLVVLGENASGKLTYVQHPLETTGDWVSVPTTGTENAQISTLQQQGNMLYLSTTLGQVLQSSNAVNWTEAPYATRSGLVLAGASDERLYALADGKLLSSDGTDEWTEEELDDSESNLPVAQLSMLNYSQTDGQQKLLLIGEKTGERDAQVWSKTWGTSGEQSAKWMYYVPNRADKHRLSVKENLNVVMYDDGLLAFGGASLDGNHLAMDSVLYSPDHGISWKPYFNDDMEVDTAIQEAAQAAQYITSAVDEDNFLWVVVDSKVWRGRINRLGFLRQDP